MYVCMYVYIYIYIYIYINVFFISRDFLRWSALDDRAFQQAGRAGIGSKRGAAAASSGRPKRDFRAFFSCVKTHDT